MKIDAYWKIIDDAKAEVGSNNQDAMLKSVETKLSELPAKEIAEWFNIHQQYLSLADRKDIEKAACDCNLYLSDDSFLYLRGWLLSLGKDAFYSVMNKPELLSEYVKASDDARFESFVYVGNEVYTDKAFLEEYGYDGMKRWKENWLAENPDKGEYSLEWALGNKYNIWEASAQKPLSKEEKEEIRKDLFAESDNKRIVVMKTNDELKDIEKVLIDLLPSDSKDYRNLSLSLYSGYHWGFGMLPAASQSFHEETGKLFKAAGWECHEPKFMSACPEYSKGKSLLYCHPTELSGPCEAVLISEVCELMAKATTCTVTKAEDRGRVFDVTEEQYTKALEFLRPEIEKDLLNEFSHPGRGSDSNRHETVMMKYKIMTLKHHTDSLASNHPYWKYTEDVLKDLISQKKIIERPEKTSFSSWNYVTAPEHLKKKKSNLDSSIKSASSRARDLRKNTNEKENAQPPKYL